MKWLMRAGLALSVVGFAPLLGLLLGLATAAAAGCTVAEASIAPCPVAGMDLGPILYGLITGGWLMLMTAPAGLAGVGLIVAAVGLRASARRHGP